MKKNILYLFTAWMFIVFLASCSEDISTLQEVQNLETTNTNLLTSRANLQSVTSINDIQNWTGTGDFRSVLAIQWVTTTNIGQPTDSEIHFLAWGYRWNSDDIVTGLDMVKDVAKHDPRLYVIMGYQWGGTVIKGFAYDGNGDGKIKISNASLTLTQANFVDGIYWEKDGQSFDGMTTDNSADLWMGGWMEAYASYWLGSTGVNVPSDFTYSSVLVSGRELDDNTWDAWTFSTINSGEVNVDPRPDLMKAAPNN